MVLSLIRLGWPAFDRRLDRGDQRRFARSAAAARASRAGATEIGVVHLDPALEFRLHLLTRLHRHHDLLLHQPGGRLAHAEPSPKLGRQDPALALADMLDCQKPDLERKLGAVKDRARGHRDLMPATIAL